MHRIKNCFNNLKEKDKKGLISFIMAGDPVLSFTLPLMHKLVSTGVDIIELGVPFSDPIADGPVIQRASERSLLNKTSLSDIFSIVVEFRKENQQTPVVLMGYLNPIISMGYEVFAKSAKEAGVDGVLVVDLPPEEAEELVASMCKYHLDLIFLISPTTNSKRQKYILHKATGFVYYVSLKGVTGSNKLDINSVQQAVALIKQNSHLPVSIGFGIKEPQVAADVASISDAIVIGSAIIELMEKIEGDVEIVMDSVGTYLKQIRYAIDHI